MWDDDAFGDTDGIRPYYINDFCFCISTAKLIISWTRKFVPSLLGARVNLRVRNVAQNRYQLPLFNKLTYLSSRAEERVQGRFKVCSH
jgi:hypothetical protein